MAKESKRIRTHGPNRVHEKPKDFKNTSKKLIKYLHDFIPLIIVSLLLATFGSILAIIGPNKISSLTDEISKGLMINSKALKTLSSDITSNLDLKNISNVSREILTVSLDQNKVMEIMTNPNISNEDKLVFQTFMSTISENTDILVSINTLPESIKKELITSSVYNGVEISADDKIIYLNVISKFMDVDEDDEYINLINDIPKSIQKVLFKDFKYGKYTITSDDQIKFLNVMSGVKDFKDGTKIYNKLDKLPEKIKSIISPTMNMKNIKKIALFLLIIYLISALFNFVRGLIMATVSNDFAKSLRNKISVKIDKLPLSYFDKNSKGDILSRVTNDVDTIGQSMNQSIDTLVGAITLFISTIVMMFITNYVMALAAIISSLIGFVLMIVITSKSQKYFNQRQIELGKLNGHIEEVYSLHNIVKAYNGEKDASKKFDVLNKNVFECNRKSQFLSGIIPPIMGFIGNFSYVAVCVVGAVLVMNNNITFGVIVAFMLYARLFTSPLSQIAQGVTGLQTIAAASERVFAILEEEEMTNEDELKEKLSVKNSIGNISFEHVKFGYTKDKIIIKDFSCKVKKGQKVAIVGPTGAGKTTLVNLLMKFYDIDSGDIIIDGKSIKDLKRENVHDLFTMVLQDTWLFNGTIRDNVCYNKRGISDKRIWKALEIVGVDHFVKTLPKQLDYKLSDNDDVSAGQKQLLTIARGMIKNSPFLILDEATSSVDTRTEELVQKAMDKLTEGKTSFIIAHRLSTIKNADLILVMKDGNIIEQGKHKELLKKNGFYADLYNSQFKKN